MKGGKQMPIEITGTLWKSEFNKGKDGRLFGNITIADLVHRAQIVVNSSEQDRLEYLQKHEGKDILLKVELNKTNFGLQFGKILDIVVSE